MAEMELAQRVWLRILDAVGQIQEREDLAMDSLPYKSTEWMMARERYETAEACYDAVCRLSPEQVLASLDAPSAERED